MSGWHRWLGIALVACACGHPASPPPPSNQLPPPVKPAPADDALLAWPVAPFTRLQAAEVNGCDLAKLAEARYPKAMTLDALPIAFAPHGACDEATLAAACGYRLGDNEPPAPCLAAYRHAVTANPAFAFAGEIISPYFGKVALVAAPPATRRPLTSVTLDYEWGGLGDAVKWTLSARDLPTTPAITITGPNGKPATWSGAVSAAVTGLGTALRGFLPIPQPLHAIDCTDNDPEWTATLTFDDGSKLELTTNGSNMLRLGGPWQTTIGGVTYLQLSPDFVRAVAKLVETLGLAIGHPAGAMCRGYNLQSKVLSGP